MILRPLSLFKARRRLGPLRAERVYSEVHRSIMVNYTITNNTHITAHTHVSSSLFTFFTTGTELWLFRPINMFVGFFITYQCIM